MKYCPQCKTHVKTVHDYCPLCHHGLNGEMRESFVSPYPEKNYRRKTLLPATKNILFFITVLAIVTLVIINLLISPETWWSLIPIGSVLYFWLAVRVGVLSRHNVAFRLATLTVVLIAIVNVIDIFYGGNKGWARNYVSPFVLLSANLALGFLFWFKNTDYRDFLLYMLTIIVFSLTPLILYFIGLVEILWPAVTVFGLAVLIFFMITLFFPSAIKEEIKKRLHF